MRKITDKKGALELSVGTIVVIVISMSMLILGLVLVRNIFSGATDSVDTINDEVMRSIQTLFQDETSEVIVMLGRGNTATIRPGTDFFGVALAAKTRDGSEVGSRERLEYKVELQSGGTDCISVLGRPQAEGLFQTSLDQWNSFDNYRASSAGAVIRLSIPSGTARCTQLVYIDVRDNELGSSAGTSFTLEVGREGVAGLF